MTLTALLIGTTVFTHALPGSAGGRTPSERDGVTLSAVRHAESVQLGSQPSTRSEGDPVYWKRHARQYRKRWLYALDKRDQWKAMATRLRANLHTSGNRRGSGRSTADPGSPAAIICRVFGSHCREAVTVARCESTLSVYARNGDYWGLFQFGSFARAHYGFAWNAWTQTKAAYRYFRDAGWAPWQCQP